jgi:drug/metabolite transporter (DMT)-like permease
MALIWGVNISVVKYGTTVMPPLAYNAVRVALAAATLLIVCTVARLHWPVRRDALQLLGLGMLGNGLYQVLFVEGVSRTMAGNAALVLAATPALIALFGWTRGVEKPTVRSMLGIALSICGVLLVVSTSAFAATSESLLGDALMLAACVCWALFTVLIKSYMNRVHSLQLAALTMAGGLLPLSIVAAGDIAATDWSSVPALAWYSMVFSGIGALVLAYLLWYHGVKVLGPTRTAMYANLQPAIALAFAWVLLSEVPTPVQVLGAFGIISGLLLARS